MGLMYCYDCKGWVSSSAECCPRCGNTRFREQEIEHREARDLMNRLRKQKQEEDAIKQGYSNAEEMWEAEKRNEAKKEFNEKLKSVVISILSVAVGLWVFIYIWNKLNS